MVNNLPMAKNAWAALVLALAVAGCGGGGAPKTADRPAAKRAEPAGEAGREAQERKGIPGKRLSPGDRIAYYQIATTSGLLRARAAAVLSGQRGTPEATLTAGRARLALVHPDSRALGALRDRLAGAIDALLRDETKARAGAAMRATERINGALARYGKGKAVRLLVPD